MPDDGHQRGDDLRDGPAAYGDDHENGGGAFGDIEQARHGRPSKAYGPRNVGAADAAAADGAGIGAADHRDEVEVLHRREVYDGGSEARSG